MIENLLNYLAKKSTAYRSLLFKFDLQEDFVNTLNVENKRLLNELKEARKNDNRAPDGKYTKA